MIANLAAPCSRPWKKAACIPSAWPATGIFWPACRKPSTEKKSPGAIFNVALRRPAGWPPGMAGHQHKKAAIARGLMCVSSRLFALLVEAQHAVLEDIQTLAQLLRLDRLLHPGGRRGVGRGRRVGRGPPRPPLPPPPRPPRPFFEHPP